MVWFSLSFAASGAKSYRTLPSIQSYTARTLLSARYMLEGTDAAGNACRIFIENQGSWQEGFTPRIVTDSSLLKELETAELTATVDGIPGGVLVRIFRKE